MAKRKSQYSLYANRVIAEMDVSNLNEKEIRRFWRKAYNKAYGRSHYAQNSERYKESARKRRERLGEKLLAEKREYYRHNSERIKANVKEWKGRPENKDRVRASGRKTYWRYRNIYLESGRRAYLANIEKSRLRNREKEGFRRSIKYKAPLPDRELTREYMSLIRNDPCSYCGKIFFKSHTDHIVPIAKGGDHHWENFTNACDKCNINKGPKSLLEFLLFQKGGDTNFSPRI